MKTLLKILLGIWELPQNIVGICLLPFYKCAEKIKHEDRVVRYCPSFPGGISLGSFVYVGSKRDETVKHEYGHTIQSKYLGPFYLFVIGLPSIIWAALYGPVIKPSINGYYKFYTEKWADKLGGVVRN